jgi:hypothetical protein
MRYALVDNKYYGMNVIVINAKSNTGKATITNNSIVSNSEFGQYIGFSEGVVEAAMDSSEIIGNYIRGHYYNFPESTNASAHGILASNGKNMIIKHNYVSYINTGYVIKATGEAYTFGGMYYNIAYECYSPLYIRRCSRVNVFNNTFYTTMKGWIVWMDYQGYSTGNLIFQNNIIYAPNIRTSSPVFTFDKSSFFGSCIYNNTIYSNATTNRFVMVMDDGSFIPLRDALNNSYYGSMNPLAQNIIEDDPNFQSTDKLWPVPRISAGLNIGIEYQDGLDTLSVWPNNLILKNQTEEAWQLGAYLQDELLR